MAALVAAADLHASIESLKPRTGAEWAVVYASEICEMRRMLAVRRACLPACGLGKLLRHRTAACAACLLLSVPQHRLPPLPSLRPPKQENNVELPADRFDDTGAELFRFAKACGLLQAKSPEARASAVEAAFSRVVHTAEWVGRQRFMTPRELRRWERLVAWKAHDASEWAGGAGWVAG